LPSASWIVVHRRSTEGGRIHRGPFRQLEPEEIGVDAPDPLGVRLAREPCIEPRVEIEASSLERRDFIARRWTPGEIDRECAKSTDSPRALAARRDPAPVRVRSRRRRSHHFIGLGAGLLHPDLNASTSSTGEVAVLELHGAEDLGRAQLDHPRARVLAEVVPARRLELVPGGVDDAHVVHLEIAIEDEDRDSLRWAPIFWLKSTCS